jgi:hypothetical protein
MQHINPLPGEHPHDPGVLPIAEISSADAEPQEGQALHLLNPVTATGRHHRIRSTSTEGRRVTAHENPADEAPYLHLQAEPDDSRPDQYDQNR